MKIFFISQVFLLLVSAIALAKSSSGGKGGEENHQLSVSGGIAAPSFSTAVFQNPAGLVYNSKFKGTAQAAIEDPFGLRGGILAGNGDFGGTAGLSHVFSDNSSTGLFYGLAAQADSLKLAVGAAGFTSLSSSGSTFNAGLMVGPNEKFTLGVTAVGVDANVKEWGAGVIGRLDGVTGLVFDSTVDSHFDHFAFQPGLIVGNPKAALTFSYGFGVSAAGNSTGNADGRARSVEVGNAVHSAELSSGFAMGGSIQFDNSASFQLYYNQLAKFYAVISFEI